MSLLQLEYDEYRYILDILLLAHFAYRILNHMFKGP